MQMVIKSKNHLQTIICLFLVLVSLTFFGAACSFSGQSNLQGTQIALNILSTQQVLKQTELAEGDSNQQDQNNPPQSPSITPSQTLRPTDTADKQINIDTAKPTSTQTAVVQPPTITPTSTMENLAGPGFQAFGDDFSDPTSGWSIQESGSNQTRYKNNQYQMRVGDPNTQWWVYYPYNISNGSVQTTAIVLQDQPQASYGVVFRCQDEGNYYYFEIASNGSYRIGRWLNSVHSYLKQGMNNSAIKSTGENFIFASFVLDELSVSVNSVLIDTVYDNNISEGFVGLSASTGEFGGFEVSFDQFLAGRD
jgi:hypothetical protein